MIQLSPSTTALILIDLQKGIVSMPVSPRSGDEVVTAAKALAERFRVAGAPVFLINVNFAADGSDTLTAKVDQPSHGAAPPADWADLVDGLAQPSDLRITKRQWGAFYGTELDLQLRRRGVTDVVIAGIATNFGVESTARAAHEHGYGVVLAEDATAGLSADGHAFSFKNIFPMLGRAVAGADIGFDAA